MASIDSVKLPNGTEYNINEKLASFTNENLVEVDANGNLKDSGIAKSTIGNKQNKTLDTSVESQTTVEGALGALSSNKQPKTMSTTVESQTTVEGALGALSTNKQAKALTASVESESTVEGALSALSTNKQAKNLTSSVESQTTVETALSALSTNKQPKTLATAITVDGTSQTTVEGALGAINTLAASNKTDKQPKTLSSAITIDGTSQTTVEGALGGLNGYADNLDDAIGAIVNVYGAKNLNTYPYQHTTKTENGITFTDNGDGTITVSGTASAEATFYLHMDDSLILKKGTYTLTGCPTGGSLSTYEIGCSVGDDIGNGLTFTISNDRTFGILIIIASGTVISTPITFKPMIRDARISDDTYVPYAMTNRELTNYVQKHALNESVSIKTYDSSSNQYTAPYDGYVKVSNNGSEGYIEVFVNYNNLLLAYFKSTDLYETHSLFVKKGMTIYYNKASGLTDYYISFVGIS